MIELTGLTALVTGSGKRVGREVARALAGEGCNILIHYRSSASEADELAAEIRRMGRDARTIRADFLQHSEVLRLAREVAAFGALDILINSASTYASADNLVADHDLLHETLEEWESSMAVNARAPFFLIQQLAPLLQRSRAGSVVNILDRSIHTPFKSRAAHTVSKTALYAVTRLAAASLLPNVRVNGIELGAILPGDEMEPLERSKLRWGGVEPVIAAVLFVLKNPFVNGEVIGVKGNALSFDG